VGCWREKNCLYEKKLWTGYEPGNHENYLGKCIIPDKGYFKRKDATWI
jgi:hypothetical protein